MGFLLNTLHEYEFLLHNNFGGIPRIHEHKTNFWGKPSVDTKVKKNQTSTGTIYFDATNQTGELDMKSFSLMSFVKILFLSHLNFFLNVFTESFLLTPLRGKFF